MSELPPPDLDKLAEFVLHEIRLQEWAERLNNPRLVWEWLSSDQQAALPLSGPGAALMEEMMTRIWPDWTAADTKLQDWGWETEDGPIVYDQEKYELWCSWPEAERL